MVILQARKTIHFLSLSLFLSIGILPCTAQDLSLGLAQDVGVLVSSNQGLEKSLVDIKAVDAPILGLDQGRMRIATIQRKGQGIIIDSQGIIATNRHIIGNATHIYVLLSNNETYEATLLHNSPSDLSLIKINARIPLRAISLADSSDIKIGVDVIAVGHGDYNPQRITDGQVIQIFKDTNSNNMEILEMNIPLKPGDSGGPILNKQGFLVGLIMAKQLSDPSKSFAIASNRIQQEYFKYQNSILN